VIRISAEEFSLAGDKYLGVPYSDMDCQKFVERVMADLGLKMDLAGSNAWFREVRKHGWVGTPEECKKIFGVIPKGALLFIWKDDGGEVARGYKDGLGNATHIGYKTGRGKGAMNSSSSNGCVCESKFQDKTIKNGGWNRVGLYEKFDYGKSVNWVLEHLGIGGQDPDPDPGEGGKKMQGKVVAENGGTVKLRQKPSTKCGTYWDIPVGTELEILEQGDEWSHCVAGGRVGWMKNEFVEVIGSGDPDQDPDQGDDFGPGDLDPDEKVTVQLQLTRQQAELLLDAADKIAWQLQQIIGARG